VIGRTQGRAARFSCQIGRTTADTGSELRQCADRSRAVPDASTGEERTAAFARLRCKPVANDRGAGAHRVRHQSRDSSRLQVNDTSKQSPAASSASFTVSRRKHHTLV
jgi:hypothetical protein